MPSIERMRVLELFFCEIVKSRIHFYGKADLCLKVQFLISPSNAVVLRHVLTCW